MGWLIAAGVLILLAIMPVGVSARYDEDGPLVSIIAGPLRIRLFPGKKKEKKEKVKKEKTQKAAQQTKKEKTKAKKKGGSLEDFLPLVEKVLDFLGAFRRKLRLNNLELNLVLASGDPADLAINYGRAWTVLGNLMPLLERSFVIKKRDLQVQCDFLAEKTLITARLDVSITIGRIFTLLILQGIPIVRELLKVLNKRKGGAKA